MTKIELLIIAAILAIIGAIGYSSYVEVAASNRCLKRGFPESKVTITLTTYCIKRVNQTDSVARLVDLK